MKREEGILEGIEKGIVKGRLEGLSALCKAFKKRGIPFQDYQADFHRLPDVAAIGDLIVEFMASQNPRDFVEERFGH